jgi:hypothetical protein
MLVKQMIFVPHWNIGNSRVSKCLHVDKMQITPAQVKQLAMEEDELTGFLDRLLFHFKKKRKTRPPRSPPSPPNFSILVAAAPAMADHQRNRFSAAAGCMGTQLPFPPKTGIATTTTSSS